MKRGGFSRRLLATSAALCALGLGACDGGSDSPAPTPTPTPTPPAANAAPVFTSAATVNVPENSTGTIYTAAATDANGDAITYSLVTGGDSALFAITAAGAVSFVSPPDFEVPRGNSGNSYKIAIQASDGKTTTQLGVTITVTDLDDADLSVVFVNDWSTPFVQIAPSPASANGVHVLRSEPQTSTTESSVYYADRVAGLFSSGGGAHAPNATISIAASPTIATDNRMYALARGTGELRIVTNYVLPGGCHCDRDSSRAWDTPVIMRIPVAAPAVAANVTGWIGFGPDGYLYVVLGDGTASGENLDFTGSPQHLLGKILRIDVSRDDFPADPDRNYGIPASNPGYVSPEIWALGIHRPSAVRFEPTGELFFTDSGLAREEVNLLPANTPRLHFGWPWFDGTQQRLAGSSAGYTPPVAEFARDSGPIQGAAILAGGVYTGTIPSLANRYVFTNVGGERLWSIPRSSLVLGSTVPSSAFTPHSLAPLTTITRIGFDRSGGLYVTTPVGRGDRLFAVLPKP